VLNQQISALRANLLPSRKRDASEKRDKESQGRIADLGQRLNVALAQRYRTDAHRSEFFGRLRPFSATPGHPHRRRPLCVSVEVF